ncbi:hypothetical protein ABZ490_00155 [Streptomyces sp. NPDC005811]|uniref:hypothetical protein n=1 Tax=Streptomyces sp. NPDC005811 TaxID=3154565 RepID=UPI0033F43408
MEATEPTPSAWSATAVNIVRLEHLASWADRPPSDNELGRETTETAIGDGDEPPPCPAFVR